MASRIEHAHLPFESLHRAVHQRDPQLHAGIVEQVTDREVVRAVQHHVHTFEQAFDVPGGHARLHGIDLRAWVERAQRRLRRNHLRFADTRLGMQDLPLQVAPIHHVVVRQPQVAYARRRQIERGRRTEPTGADHQHPRAFEPPLAFDADFGQQQVPRVAFVEVHRIGRQFGPHQWTPFLLPARRAAGDRGQARVARRFEHPRCIQ